MHAGVGQLALRESGGAPQRRDGQRDVLFTADGVDLPALLLDDAAVGSFAVRRRAIDVHGLCVGQHLTGQDGLDAALVALIVAVGRLREAADGLRNLEPGQACGCCCQCDRVTFHGTLLLYQRNRW